MAYAMTSAFGIGAPRSSRSTTVRFVSAVTSISSGELFFELFSSDVDSRVAVLSSTQAATASETVNSAPTTTEKATLQFALMASLLHSRPLCFFISVIREIRGCPVATITFEQEQTEGTEVSAESSLCFL